ncbi:D-2-hydroxyglutarate dehydrogenase, mitochondrial [Octopus sinensis]|uniref:D-2-hydroxyglutarate dehydrogenase, mitochondrial n=1 Tax=Octopus sinensis TaxID=2607531 RepID=A0A6P7SZ82_9MOLL|nr:D-2-hydroxyglutarate dehydrogenase, mitochondrial [Octopus sinensis]
MFHLLSHTKHIILFNSRKLLPKCRHLRSSILSKNGRFLSTHVELTSVKHPEILRGSYSKLSDKDLAVFESILTSSRCITDSADLEFCNTDWMKIYRGASCLMLLPKTTSEVSEILSYCNERNLAVVPQGGNTGLVGGSIPVFDEIVISTRLMNNIISLDKVSGKGQGFEMVLADGRVLDCMNSLKKNNTGYDLKQLFIGSEGTLGIITKVSISCPQKPNNVNVALLGCNSFSDVLKIFTITKQKLAEILSAFEFIDAESMKVVTQNLKLSSPIGKYPFYVLIETSGSNGNHDEEKINVLLEDLMQTGTVTDGTLAGDMTQMKNLWCLRERISESLLKDGYCYKYDLSLCLSKFYDLVVDVRKRTAPIPNTRVVGYGHVGDSNLHLNLTSPEYNDELQNLIEPYVFDYVAELKGSISAEHGIGLHKVKYLHHSQSHLSVELMKQMKKLLDPCGILNPYKMFP